jgi:excisionase family DNA binding protein
MRGHPSPASKAAAEKRDFDQSRRGYITIREAAEATGRPEPTVYMWARKGWLKLVTKLSNRLYVSRKEVLAFAKTMNVGGPS